MKMPSTLKVFINCRSVSTFDRIVVESWIIFGGKYNYTKSVIFFVFIEF